MFYLFGRDVYPHVLDGDDKILKEIKRIQYHLKLFIRDFYTA